MIYLTAGAEAHMYSVCAYVYLSFVIDEVHSRRLWELSAEVLKMFNGPISWHGASV